MTEAGAGGGTAALLAAGLAALLAGMALGLLFFGGLWFTVQRLARTATPARWFLGSLVLRTALVLAGLYLVGAGQPLRLGLCLLGFWLARAWVLRRSRLHSPPCA